MTSKSFQNIIDSENNISEKGIDFVGKLANQNISKNKLVGFYYFKYELVFV
jgi:hypothetical protein